MNKQALKKKMEQMAKEEISHFMEGGNYHQIAIDHGVGSDNLKPSIIDCDVIGVARKLSLLELHSETERAAWDMGYLFAIVEIMTIIED